MKNPNPEKFYMSVAHGVKAEARADAPDVEVPFCHLHQRWPCHVCGTTHYEGCECSICEPERAGDAYLREAAGYASSMILGLERHWRRHDTVIADQMIGYARALRKLSDGGL